MSYFNRTSGPGADQEPVGAEALRGSGVTVSPAPPAKAPAARRDPSTAAPAPAPAPFESASAVAHVAPEAQVAALQAAAKDGTPFCEECEKAKRPPA